MAYELRDYAGGAEATTLAADITSSSLTIMIASSTGWPSGGANGPFHIVINRGESTEETIEVESRTGTTLTVASTSERGVDGSTAAAHTTGATVEHCHTAQDAQEANSHLADTSLDHHTQYLNTTRHDTTTRHTIGTVVPAGTPGTIQPDDAAASGSANSVARSDHTHAITTDTAVSVGTANAEGTSTSFARADHTHDLESTVALVPTGALMPYGGSAAPSNWLLCDGSAVSRATYSDLFAVLGETYGVGDGSSTFNLPDLQQRFPLGKAASGTGSVLGETGGEIDHAHSLDTPTAVAQIESQASGTFSPFSRRKSGVTGWDASIEMFGSTGGTAVASSKTGITNGTGLQGDTEALNPPYVTFNFIIKT